MDVRGVGAEQIGPTIAQHCRRLAAAIRTYVGRSSTSAAACIGDSYACVHVCSRLPDCVAAAVLRSGCRCLRLYCMTETGTV
jgi:hypothetical protein